nr:hypothetical protein MFLOJ_45180 [Mycobacterium florentinum]
MSQKVDVAAQPAEPDGDVERTAADMFVVPDDIDQRLADHQRAVHRTNRNGELRRNRRDAATFDGSTRR